MRWKIWWIGVVLCLGCASTPEPEPDPDRLTSEKCATICTAAGATSYTFQKKGRYYICSCFREPSEQPAWL